MPELFDYSVLFNQALIRIKDVRDPHAQKPETVDLKWNKVEESALFRFSDTGYRKYATVLTSAKNTSISCVNEIIRRLLLQYGYDYQEIVVKEDENDPSSSQLLSTLRLSILIKSKKELLLFKEIEECPFWKKKGSEPAVFAEAMKKGGAEKCRYIYYMLDHAYVHIIGHNDDESDPGRGYNLYSLKWFFNDYFGEDECNRFLLALEQFIGNVKNYLGYILVKSLTPYTLLNFQRVTEDKIIRFPYDRMLSKVIKKEWKGKKQQFVLETYEFSKIEKQFLSERVYSILLGTHDFAESIITAEWLHDSMQKAKAIDLTIVGTGYFKAVEQLLWELICLHKNDGREMKKNDSTQYLELSEENIQNQVLDSSLGSMAVFYSRNLDILRGDLSRDTKRFIRESLFDYRDLRNGYFHKHNIHSWDKIEEIRNESFNIIFLLLGAQALSEANVKTLGFVMETKATDFYQLCEYMNYHSGEIFFITTPQNREVAFIACSDYYASTAVDGHMDYSGIYVRSLENGQRCRITEAIVPKEVSLGKMVFQLSDDEQIRLIPMKIRKVFENGKFVGPSIAYEDTLDY